MHHGFRLVVCLNIMGLVPLGSAMAVELELSPRRRCPESLVVSASGETIVVANRCGTLTLVDWNASRVSGEWQVGEQLSHIIRLPNDRYAVTDFATGELLQVDLGSGVPQVAQRLAVSQYPASCLFDASRDRVYVTGHWSQRLDVVDVSQDGWRVLTSIDMPFAPREMTWTPDRLIVADAFGGQLALVDLNALAFLQTRKFPGHNIRGMLVTPETQMLVVAHQMLNELAHSVRNDVHWGLLMSNDLRWLRVSSVLDDSLDFFEGAHMHPLGEASSGTGDPSGLALGPDGTIVVALGGVDQIAVGREENFGLYRVDVGKRPTAVTFVTPRWAVVANSFEDSLSVVNLDEREEVRRIPLGPTREPTLIERGERLFYDASLSHDSWMSCHSCHTDGHTNNGLNDNFSDQSFGAPKRVLSLLGKVDTAPFAWNAEVADYRQQIHNSIMSTMQGDREPKSSQIEALEAYLQSLQPPPSLSAARGTLETEAIEAGREVFLSRNCGNCHAPPTYTTPTVYDVGLVDEEGNRLFNPPSLRGVSQRGPFLHDNRAESLRDVFTVHGHPPGVAALSDQELELLLAFLNSL